ncbi:hypothetical protein EDB87DRAFT_1633641 [Lactarius vividus]|nr:hypothetical protein EDB87DRAFT_1633641 [Lactarius vividus]
MIFDASTSDHLKPWLTRTLEPICDADPTALAEYILALLKHNGPEPELRKELASQLDEFLEKEGPPFIDALFTTLRTKSYLPYSPPGPDRSRKRPSDYEDSLRPPKGPRMSQDGPFSRHGPHRGPGWNNGNWNGSGPSRPGFPGSSDAVNGGMGQRMNGRGPSAQYHPPGQGRGICRDYYNNGYCARGAYCKFSHGDDALVPGVFPMGPQQMPGNMFMPMFPPGMPFGMGPPPAAYDPHEARLDIQSGPPPGPMGRPQRTSMLPRANGDGPSMHPHTSGELPVIQDLTPPAPVPSPNVDTQPNGASPPAAPVTNMEVDTTPASGPSSHSLRPPRTSQNTGTRGRGGRPGVYGGDVQRFHPERRGDKTLVVEKIPEDKLSLDAVNSWFKRFGTVTNVAVDAASAKALVSFSTHEEAQAAWKTEEAVFGNRFVKVFWHRPMDGQGLVGQRALAASAPIVASVVAKEQVPASTSDADPQSSTGTAQGSKKAPSSSSQKLLEQQIAEQKVLMEKLNTAPAEEKKEIFAQLRKLGQEIKASSAQTAFAPLKKPSPSAPRPEDREAKERERLDKELELHSAAVDGEETTEALQAKLAKLKAEAASLGIDPLAESAPAYPYNSHRGRGRGRGRAFFRGAARGGPPRAGMKLDNRPKRLLVKEVGSDGVQAVRDWYEAGGQVDAVETLENGDVVVTFKTRAAAEQGLAKGSTIPPSGQKQISWYHNGPLTSTSAAGATTAPPKATPDLSNDEEYGREQSTIHTLNDEEPAVSGWGGDEEDGMGML